MTMDPLVMRIAEAIDLCDVRTANGIVAELKRKADLLDSLYEISSLEKRIINDRHEGWEWYIQLLDPDDDDTLKDRERFYRAIEAEVPERSNQND